MVLFRDFHMFPGRVSLDRENPAGHMPLYREAIQCRREVRRTLQFRGKNNIELFEF